MSMEKNLKEFLEELIQEVEKELDEATATGAVAGYQTPMAFSDKGKSDKKRKKKIATSMGYSVVGNDVDNISEASDSEIKKSIKKKEKGGPYTIIVRHGNYDKKIVDHSPKSYDKVEDAIKMYHKYNKKHKGRGVSIEDGYGRTVFMESVNEATIKGRNNKTGESFGMVIGSDKQGNNGYELKVRKMYNSRISAYGFIFDKDSNLIDIRDYGYSLDGKFPDMRGHASSTSVRPNKRETITQIAKITSPAFAKKIYQHVQKNNKMNESVNEAAITYGIEYKSSKKDRKFKKASLTKTTHNPNIDKMMIKAISKDAKSLAKQDGWVDYRITKNGVPVKESVNEAKAKRPVNRWLELKNDESMHPHKKMAMGLKELKYQLRETEKFFNWYNKIKTMNELDSNQYWKRTNKHIYSIKEKLINIARTIQEIEK